MNSRRQQRVAELIKTNAGYIIQRELAGLMPAMATIMRVDVSDDLKYAKIFVSFYGSDDNKKRSYNILRREVKNIRSQLGGVLKLRYLPFLTFIEDSTLDHAFKIENLLSRINEDEEGSKNSED
ncbi:30S ribosome-binding factor RbfA [candidate division KSB1 bacterium]